MKKLIATILTSYLMIVAASAGYYQITFNPTTKEHRVIAAFPAWIPWRIQSTWVSDDVTTRICARLS